MTARAAGRGAVAAVARPAADLIEWWLGTSVVRDRLRIAVPGARLLRALDRLTDTRVDTSRAGRALLAAVPDALGPLTARLSEGCVLISATNGKTTTTNLLAGILAASGRRPVVNRAGANMPGGLAAELVAHPRGDIGVFEVDELWLDQVVDSMRPRVLVLGPLFADQLDRTGGVDRVAERWASLLARLPATTTLVVTADDPRVWQLTADHPTTMAVGRTADEPPSDPAPDTPACRRCGGDLVYEALTLGHLGQWDCGGCGDGRPTELAVEATAVSTRGIGGSTATLRFSNGGDIEVDLRLPGRYAIDDAVAAAGAAIALGCDERTIVDGLARAEPTFGRGEQLLIGEVPLTLLLVKNRCSLDETIALLVDEGSRVDLLLLAHDLDGAVDLTWLTSTAFERLVPLVDHATCGGDRAASAADQLRTAGVPGEQIDERGPVAEALAHAVARRAGPAGVIAVTTYWAMLDVRETIAEQGYASRYWR